MDFRNRLFSFLLVAAFLLSHGFAEYSHQLYHASRNEVCLNSSNTPVSGSAASEDSACPIEKLLKSVANESFHLAAPLTLIDLSLEHQREAQLFTKIYSVPAYRDEFSRGPPLVSNLFA